MRKQPRETKSFIQANEMELTFDKNVEPSQLDLFKEKLQKVLNSVDRKVDVNRCRDMGKLEYDNSVRMVQARMTELRRKLGINNDCN